MTSTIKEITPDETLQIRHKVMWPHKTIEYVKLPNDDEGRHFGLFLGDTMISVISLFINARNAQFRKFATLQEYQGKGFGTILLKNIISIAEADNLNKIWCNARSDKTNYYAKFGMTITNQKFTKGGIDYVIMEKNLPI